MKRQKTIITISIFLVLVSIILRSHVASASEEDPCAPAAILVGWYPSGGLGQGGAEYVWRPMCYSVVPKPKTCSSGLGTDLTDKSNNLNSNFSTVKQDVKNIANVQKANSIKPFSLSLSKGEQMWVRNTKYNKTEPGVDQDTKDGKTKTQLKLQFPGPKTIGIAAVDPNIIPYGSIIKNGPNYYVAADTGKAVCKQTASNGTAPVIDYYSKNQVGNEYSNVTIYRYTGSVPFVNSNLKNQKQYINYNNVAAAIGQ